MATIALNKMKSRLTTRNQFTGRAMERMTKEKLEQLFNGDLNYMSWEQKYLERRFDGDTYLEKIRKERRETFEKEKERHIDSLHLINLTEMLEEEEKNDIELQNRFKSFVSKHNGDKPVLALDVDNTLIYVRFFSEEMKIDDVCTYFGVDQVEKNNSKILKIRLTLSLDVTNSDLIDIFGKERVEYFYWTSSNEELKKYRKGAFFEYPLNENKQIEFIKCKIRKVEVSGCLIFIEQTREEIEIDFTTSNESLNQFEPCLERDGLVPVTFIYEGFLVRLRPNLDEFMEYINDDFDVVIYTSANKIIYQGLLNMLHDYLMENIGIENDTLLWSDILYRDDCILLEDYRGKLYHQKDLGLFGCHLSRLIMLDNSPIVCQGQEPNMLYIKDFFGKDDDDDELMDVYQLLDAISNITGDVRYFLCGLEQDNDIQIDESINISTKETCLNLTIKLINTMKTYYGEKMNHFNELSVDDYTDHFDDDFDDDDDIKNEENIFKQLPTKRILQDLELNVSDSIDPDVENEIIETEFIPTKHSKTESIVSIRDLAIIKQEKLMKKERKISFAESTDFTNKGRGRKSSTRKRRKSSNLLNSMAPRPSNKALLTQSKQDDFFMKFLQQLANQDDEDQNNKQIIALQRQLQRLKRESDEKTKQIQLQSNKEKQLNESIKIIQNEINEYKDINNLREQNDKLSKELKMINDSISVFNQNKAILQNQINDVIESKISLIKSTSSEIEHYRQLIRQIAAQKLSLSFV